MTPRMLQAVIRLAAGETSEQVSASLGLKKGTMPKWLTRSDFKAELERRHETSLADSKIQLAVLARNCIATAVEAALATLTASRELLGLATDFSLDEFRLGKVVHLLAFMSYFSHDFTLEPEIAKIQSRRI